MKKTFIFRVKVLLSVVTTILLLTTLTSSSYAAAPAITSITPISGLPVSGTVVIAGSGFNDTATRNVVWFGGVQATVVTATANSLLVTVPLGAQYSSISVLNLTTRLTAVSANQFAPDYDNSCYIPGTSSFKPRVDFNIDATSDSDPYYSAIGDIDGDGMPDLVVCTYQPYSGGLGYMYIYRNTGVQGQLSYAAPVLCSVANGGRIVKLGDLDGDGKLDIVIACSGSGRVSCIRNKSTPGNISVAPPANKSFSSGPIDVALADFDGDGKLDIACAIYQSNTIEIYRNIITSIPSGGVGAFPSTGTFTNYYVAFTAGNTPLSISATDVDGDNKPDLIASNYTDGTISVLRNISLTDTFIFEPNVDYIAGAGSGQVKVMDINGDNKPEIIVANNTDNSFTVFQNNVTTTPLNASSFTATTFNIGAGTGPAGLDMGDFDGDGKTDIVFSDVNSNTLSVFKNTFAGGTIGSSTFTAGSILSTGSSSTPQGVTVGDMDGDNKPDIVVGNIGSNTISIFKNTATPDTNSIRGIDSLCMGNSMTLASQHCANGSAYWSVSNANATIAGGAGALDSNAVITGVTAGLDTVTMAVVSLFDTNYVHFIVRILPIADTGIISGPANVCVNSTISLSETVTGGTWSSSNNAVATVSATGVVTGVAPGNATIFYTASSLSCGPLSASHAVTVNALPNAGTITGANGVCTGSSITLTASLAGGTWVNKYPTLANAVPTGTTNVITGLIVGADTILYIATTTLCGSDTAKHPVGVVSTGVSLPISGPDSVCQAATISLSNGATGGTWVSNNTAVATVDAVTGVVSGVSTGTITISYTVAYGCGPVVATKSITVKAIPNAGTITGADSVCFNASISLTTSGTGGTWSSASNPIATVNASGNVFGATNTLSTTTISYTASTFSCGSATATHPVTVKHTPVGGAITGADSVCSAASISLANVTGDLGTWSSASNAIATVDASGNVFGVATALSTTTISYTVNSFSCGSATVTHPVTVKALPNAGTITGADSVCFNASISLTTSGTGGTWSSASNPIATVNASGNVFGATNTLSTTTISYTASTFSCGSATTTHPVTVKHTPVGGAITGVDSVCSAASISLANITGDPGTWSSASNAIATVDASGNVFGVATTLSTTTISYTVNSFSCGSATVTHPVTVKALPNAGTITGADSVCFNASISLTTSGTGGTWSSASNPIATVNASGNVFGATNTLSTTTISYTASTFSCGSATATHPVTVKHTPVGGAITGADSVCSAASISLTNVTGDPGTWSSASNTIATVDASGNVFGVATTLSTTTISYTVNSFSCGSATVTHPVTVKALPNAGSITGADSVCFNASISLTTTGTGGTWSSASNAIATVNASGNVFGATNTLSTTTISYTVPSFSCGSASVTHPVTVKHTPVGGAITGLDSVCSAASISLTNATGDPGTWSSANTAIATVNATGNVFGAATTLSTTTISYTVNSFSCGSATVTHPVTVKPLPNAGTISGASSVCNGATISLTDPAPGGTWSSASNAIATVSATGVVGGASVTLANTTISYTVSTFSCGSATATQSVTVNPLPNAGSISGLSTVCEATQITLTDAAPGGTWSSSNNGTATVSSTGVVGGVLAGNVTISYTVTNTCGTAIATWAVTVNPQPVAGTITGITTVCEASVTTLSNTATGGVWGSQNTSVATVAGGTVGGVAAGTVLISYTVSNSCGSVFDTALVTVNPLPHAGTISGPVAVCEASTISLTSTVGGGVWSSSNTTRATISATGTVGGVTAGTLTISYAYTNSCGTDYSTYPFTVNPLPHAGTITGIPNLCPGTTTTLSSTTPGGIWISGNTGIATVTSGGVVGGVTPGSVTISYSYTNVCGTDISTFPAVVIPFPTAGTITGPSLVCPGATVTLGSTVGGGVWSSLNTAVVTVTSGTGVVGGVAPGTASIKYTVTNFCGVAFTTHPMTVNPIVVPSVTITLTPNDTVCAGTLVTFTPTPVNGGPTPTYIWTIFGSPVDTANIFTYAPANFDYVSCIMISSAPCPVPPSDTSAGISMFVRPVVTPTITIVSSVAGDLITYLGEIVTFFSTVNYGGTAPTYQWYLNGVPVTGATNATYSTEIYSDDTVYCIMTSDVECATSSFDTSDIRIIRIGTLGIGDAISLNDIAMYPNPNNGSFTVSGKTNSASNTKITYQVIDMMGRIVHTAEGMTRGEEIKQEIKMGDNIPPGNYIMRIVNDGESKIIHFTLNNN